MEGRRSPQRSEPPGNRSDGASFRAALLESGQPVECRGGRPDDEPRLSFAISRLGASPIPPAPRVALPAPATNDWKPALRRVAKSGQGSTRHRAAARYQLARIGSIG
jgi:hypothetical protein